MKYKKQERNGENTAECISFYKDENGEYKFTCSPTTGTINFERNISLCRDIPFDKTYCTVLSKLCY